MRLHPFDLAAQSGQRGVTGPLCRREWLRAAMVASAFALSLPSPLHAPLAAVAADVPTPKELSRLTRGYDRINYLLASARHQIRTRDSANAPALPRPCRALLPGARATPSRALSRRLGEGHVRQRRVRRGVLTCVAVTVPDWEDITTICNGVMSDEERMQVARTEGGTLCNKSPLKVQARAAARAAPSKPHT